MELDFDKEIDALLRKARGTEAAGTASDLAHLDADEIAAFAENALPEKTRHSYITHFAACDRCRKILSQSILLNAEAEQNAASAPEIAAPTLQRPAWRQSLFGMPTIAYTMGVLVLLFSGFLGLVVWENMGGGAEVSRVAQNEPYSTAANSNTAAAPAANAARNAVNAAGTSANMTAANMTAVGQAPSSAANGAENAPAAAEPVGRTLATPRADEQAKTLGPPADEKVQQPAAAAAPPPPAPKNVQEKTKTTDSLAASKDDRDEVGKIKQRRVDSELRAMKKEAPVTAMRAAKPSLNERNATPMMDGASGGFVATRTVNGRSFTKKDGVWYDAGYHGQSTINVRRGTDAYKKLDGGLRSIADSLGGTVVAVWKEKAYRIQ